MTRAVKKSEHQYVVYYNTSILAYINYSPTRGEGGWWVNPMSSSRRSSRNVHPTAKAAAKAFKLRIDAWVEDAAQAS